MAFKSKTLIPLIKTSVFSICNHQIKMVLLYLSVATFHLHNIIKNIDPTCVVSLLDNDQIKCLCREIDNANECPGTFLGKTVNILVILNPTGYMLAWNLYTFLGRFHSMSERCSYAMISLSLLCIDGFK